MIKELVFEGKKWLDDQIFPLVATTKASASTAGRAVILSASNGTVDIYFPQDVGIKVIVSPEVETVQVTSESYAPSGNLNIPLGTLKVRRMYYAQQTSSRAFFPDDYHYIPDDDLTNLQRFSTVILENGGVKSLYRLYSRACTTLREVVLV